MRIPGLYIPEFERLPVEQWAAFSHRCNQSEEMRRFRVRSGTSTSVASFLSCVLAFWFAESALRFQFGGCIAFTVPFGVLALLSVMYLRLVWQTQITRALLRRQLQDHAA